MSPGHALCASLIIVAVAPMVLAGDSAEAAERCFERELIEIRRAAHRQDLELLTAKSGGALCAGLAGPWQAGYLAGYLGYRHAGLLLAGEDGTADRVLRQAVDDLRAAIAVNEQCAACHALLSSVYGRRISLRPLRGITLGSRASGHMKRANELGTDSAVVALLDGIGKLNTPSMFGGGLDRALETLKAASISIDSDEQQLGFGAADALFWYGYALTRSGDDIAGMQCIERALEIEPAFAEAMQLLRSVRSGAPPGVV